MNNEKPRLWTRNFVLIIVINFLVFMNHIMLLSTFPFYIESLGGSEALGYIVIGVLAFLLGAGVTVLAARLRRMQEDEGGKENGEDGTAE